ncbi:TadE-like protein [Desulforamulus putei DSM 12395]|uniref:TadE-like protein n=1 Tax=Desulforamulus putei DSM 12395 TaxID=1121429 RepID=A0A1M4ZGN8_9FIRM|nr:TadE family protein [Desulforamulus putei]SHF17118.1 TadE-like protein [Desulforamulus putei DSM 12395]
MNTNTPTQANITGDERGQAMLEFAGSIIIFLMLYLFFITIGLRIADYTAVQKAARDGSRQAVMTGDISKGLEKAQQTAWMWKLEQSKINISFNSSNYGQRKFITCEVKYRSSPFSSMFPTLVGGQPVDEKELTGKSTFGWWDFGD